MVTVHGKVKPGFEGVSEAFVSNFNDGFEVGASVAVIYKGEMVVDIWGGIARWNVHLNGRATPL